MQNLRRICAKIARKMVQVAHKLSWKCAKIARNLHKLRANWAEKSAENLRKIARKLRVNVLWLRRKVFHGFV